MSPNTAHRPLILASTSRYRAGLLERFGLPFEKQDPAVDETERAGESPRARAFRLSEAKAEAVASRFPQAIVIGGDQVPATSTTILNKPGNAANCREQLMLLSGSTAEFYTACTIRCLETGVRLLPMSLNGSAPTTISLTTAPRGRRCVRPEIGNDEQQVDLHQR